jgi:hypothetical protein
MSTSSASLRLGGSDVPAVRGPDRRRASRYELSLAGRFMRADKLDYPCRLTDISVNGASMTAALRLTVGEKLIVYLMHLGGLEGRVVRVFPGGFAMEISATQRKREKLAVQIPRLASRNDLNDSEEREFPRVPAKEVSSLVLPDGTILSCPLRDVSLSGASIITPVRPPLGVEVVLGSQRATVVRYHAEGIAVEFVNQRLDEMEKPDSSAFGTEQQR